MNPNVQKARRLLGVVSLVKIRLVQQSAQTKIARHQLTDAMNPRFRVTAKSLGGLSQDSTFLVRASIDLLIAEGLQPPVVSLKTTYELEYGVPADFTVSLSELRAFADVNGAFNAWPYFREFIQSAMLRMDLPPVILPVYRVPQPLRATTRPSD